MDTEQISIITKTIPVLEHYGQRITESFYKNMLAAHPELNSVFNRTNQKTGHQAKVLAEALHVYAANINNLEALAPTLELICHKYASLQVSPNQYEIVGKYLIEAMQEVLQDDFTPEIQEAWIAAYGQLSGIMIEAERAIYDKNKEWQGWRDFRIIKISRESDEISSFYMAPLDGKPLPGFKPGQYVSINLLVPQLGYMQARQYSMSDVPSSKYYRISVKQEEGQRFAAGIVSNILHGLEDNGNIVQLSHPSGNFYLENATENSPVVLVAGGVGITPLLSMLKFLSSPSAAKRPIHLIYATKSTAARAFFKEITGVSDINTNFRATYFVETPDVSDRADTDYHRTGRTDLHCLHPKRDLFLSDATTEYYICGPSPFLNLVKASLISKGVERSKIKMEVFGAGGFVESKPRPHL